MADKNKKYRNQHPLYGRWCQIKGRCNNPNHSRYIDYGGRGITYCDKWETFEGFLDDMESSYQRGLSIDRINNDKGYSKENCRWATQKEQSRNTRQNRLFKGKTLVEWSELLGIKRSTLAQRVYVYGWSVDRALSTNIVSETT